MKKFKNWMLLVYSTLHPKTHLKKSILSPAFMVYAVLCISPILVLAQADTIQGPVPIPMIPSAMAGPSPMLIPGMTGPLKANPRPIGYNTGILGTVYITGVASG